MTPTHLAGGAERDSKNSGGIPSKRTIPIELCLYNESNSLVSLTVPLNSTSSIWNTPESHAASVSVSSSGNSSVDVSPSLFLHQLHHVKVSSTSLLQVGHIKKLVRITYPTLPEYTLYATTNQGERINASDTDAFETFITQYVQVRNGYSLTEKNARKNHQNCGPTESFYFPPANFN